MAAALAQYVTTDASATTLSLTLPAAPVAGDLLVLIVSSTYYQSYVTPAGWTPFGAVTVSGNASGIAYTKIATGTEQTVVVTFGNATTNAGWYGEFSGFASFSGSVTSGTGATSCPFGASVPAISGSVVLACICPNGSNAAATTPTGYSACTHGSTFHSAYAFTLPNPPLGSNVAQPTTFAMNDYVAWAFLVAPAAGGAVGNLSSAAGAIGDGRNPAGAIGNG